MPGARIFIDSTTLLYSNDHLEIEKRTRAQYWLEALTIADAGRTNLQVLNEVTNVLVRKVARFRSDDPFAEVDAFALFGSSPVSMTTVQRARAIHRATRYAWWDCLLLASALELRCTHFLSEDLQDGQVIDGLTIVDPFAHTPEQILS